MCDTLPGSILDHAAPFAVAVQNQELHLKSLCPYGAQRQPLPPSPQGSFHLVPLLQPLSVPYSLPHPIPERASMDGKSQQLETPRESVAQLYHRFSKMVLVVMTFPWTVDTLQ